MIDGTEVLLPPGLSVDYTIHEEALADGVEGCELRLDEETAAWLGALKTKRRGSFRTLLQRTLREYVSDFDANALLDMYPMFLLSRAQIGTLLHLQPDSRLTSALDVGAGSGDVTRALVPWCDRLVTTERSWGMARRLRKLGFECLRIDLAEAREALPGAPFQLISCFNVLDRSPKPASLLRAMRALLAPGGRLLLSVPLPYEPMFYAGAKTLDPLEALDVAGSEWSSCALDLCARVLPAHGLRALRLSRAPYLSGGDSRRAAYVLDTAVVVAEASGVAEPG